ncbi:MAG: hypothetical protein ABH811_00515 [archaeon]
MKKEVIVLVLLGILLVSPLVLAQEQSQTYLGFSRFVDSVKLTFSGGDSKVQLALEIREKEVNSAMINVQNQEKEKAIKNLENAKEKLQIVQEKVSLDTSEEVKSSTEEIVNKVNKDETLLEYFDEYILEEEKTQLTAVLTEKTYEYCSELAKEDFALMLKDEECNPETAPEPLKEDLEKLRDLQERMFVKLMLEIRSCIDDPGTCNCENNFDDEEKIKCEKMVALALKCEYQDDEGACNELNSLNVPKAESFVPKFLMNLFRAKEEQMLWGETPSDCVPEECWNENDKPECRQYDKFKETEKDWDEYGNFIGTRNKCGKEGSIPTMRESIPQCFDGDVFLEEKCGKITMVENEEGLINYIIGKEVKNTIDEFENKSEQNKIDVNGTEGRTMVNEIKQEMNQIKEQIAERTFAPGTSGIGEGKQDVQNVVVEEGESSGDDNLKPEVKTDVASGGHEENNVIDERDTGSNEVVGNDGSAPGDTDEGNDVITNNINP